MLNTNILRARFTYLAHGLHELNFFPHKLFQRKDKAENPLVCENDRYLELTSRSRKQRHSRFHLYPAWKRPCDHTGPCYNRLMADIVVSVGLSNVVCESSGSQCSSVEWSDVESKSVMSDFDVV